MLAHPNVATKEDIVRTYDHEVRGGTIVRPFTGPEQDGPSDAAVLKPLGTWRHNRAVAISAGINPLLGKRDPYAMAVSAVDEAVRNAVAVGADPDRIAILDNFCWGNPTLPDRLGSLVRACQGCYDAAVAYGTPFISGKDSLNNEYNGTPIPGTLLISAIAIVPDMNDLRHRRPETRRKQALFARRDETGARRLPPARDLRTDGRRRACHAFGPAPSLSPPSPRNHWRGLVEACHDVSEGGIAVALAEMAIGGRLGVDAESARYPHLDATDALFSESNGRLILEVTPGTTKARCARSLPTLR